MFRYLRIAAAAMCLVACLIVIAFWVRTGRWHHFLFGDGMHDCFIGRVSATRDFAITSMQGHMRFCWYRPPEEIESFRDRFYGLRTGGTMSTAFFEGGWKREYFYGKAWERFGYERTTYGYVVIAPHWFLAALFGALAAGLVPSWTKAVVTGVYSTIRRIRIPRRFSLGTLLIAVAVVAAVLVIIRAIVSPD